MRMSQEEKDRTHERIVASASAMVRQRGLDGTSVADVMQAAGLTHGGFYKHFDSKEAMLGAALDAAFDDIAKPLVNAGARVEAPRLARLFRRFYLSRKHLANPARGCPVAALGGDVGRASATVRDVFGAGVNRMVSLLADGVSGNAEVRRARATRQLATMVGAVVIARACDPQTARSVLTACRQELA